MHVLDHVITLSAITVRELLNACSSGYSRADDEEDNLETSPFSYVRARITPICLRISADFVGSGLDIVE